MYLPHYKYFILTDQVGGRRCRAMGGARDRCLGLKAEWGVT